MGKKNVIYFLNQGLCDLFHVSYYKVKLTRYFYWYICMGVSELLVYKITDS